MKYVKHNIKNINESLKKILKDLIEYKSDDDSKLTIECICNYFNITRQSGTNVLN